jgi:hypothetical protein
LTLLAVEKFQGFRDIERGTAVVAEIPEKQSRLRNRPRITSRFFAEGKQDWKLRGKVNPRRSPDLPVFRPR